MKIIYESFDGKQFKDKDECIQYEQTYFKSRADEILNLVGQVKEYCNNTDGCEDCPFYIENSCSFRNVTNSCPWDW